MQNANFNNQWEQYLAQGGFDSGPIIDEPMQDQQMFNESQLLDLDFDWDFLMQNDALLNGAPAL